ncbi:MAG: molybdopterin-dependent oxidoreductase Mo/Fe-S-binding subunit [Candidatus Wallbacteria bacterium HGW-Wallbacteria-1]|jgi:putative selenate reductase molybdopterin-binding subunit|uniref:Molybdopterin-dependent oxidoreductase Mo/Fe-S-binding subunit n=1 Tax=Candidatus Wallbacteria bacterium HGW-Wallbacteria-1 TaxID=2013854 RepID=A0A2N1PUG1_9BACT|nr:MAG: molybdopterin-dependent oxidoreductase Mo/Fe-S-binding subunit [Candidatus Wallbacteria bacterium HGW-Wallbacteria-1]
MKINCNINGKSISFHAQAGEKAHKTMRRLGYMSVKDGCNGEGTCGTCSIIFNGKLVNSCLLLAPQLEGAHIFTSEDLARGRGLHIIQEAFLDSGIVQCGYCTPAMLLAAKELLSASPSPSKKDVTEAFSGIICRCTGYQQIFDAIEIASRRIAGDKNFKKPAMEFRGDLRMVGKVRRKVDGVKLVKSNPSFVEDMIQPDTLVLKVLRSPHAHAIIKSIDTSRAMALEGVEYIATHENVPDILYNSAGQGYPEPSPYDRRLINSKMRFVGDRVAAIAACSEEIAEKAMSLIDVEYEVLPAVFNISDAARTDAPKIHDQENVHYCFPIGSDLDRNLAASASGGIGDLDIGFSEADEILERTYKSPHIQCTPLEPHVVYTRMDGDRLVIHASTQVPWHLRRITARILQIPETRIRVIKERVGGGFGAKQDIVLEELAAYVTWITGKPIYFRFTREEEFVCSRTRHPTEVTVRIGAKRDGKITALKMHLKADTGAYGPHCLTVPMNACSKSLPLIRCANMHFAVDVYYTNNVIAGAYQGYGAPAGSFAVQMALREMAEKISMDHMTFIRVNHVRTGDRLEILKVLGEGQEGIPQKVSSCGISECLDRGQLSMNWYSREQGALPHLRIGKGFAIVQQGSGLPGLDSANALVKQTGDGNFIVLSGGTDLGTGLDTVSVKMVAEVLKLDQDLIAIQAADTDTTPFDVGSYASSGTMFSGGAALKAAQNMETLLKEVAGDLMGHKPETLTLEWPGKVVAPNGKEMTYAQIAAATQNGTGRGQLIATGCFTCHEAPIPYGAHFAKVEVNTLSGKVRILAFHAYQDCGTPVNPDLALGQIYGGVLKSIGHSLTEKMRFDSTGRCVNANFLDYKVPTIKDLPDDFRAETVFVDDHLGPFGAKSISEIATNGAAPSIAAAIHDATGIWVREYPFTSEDVLAALQD